MWVLQCKTTVNQCKHTHTYYFRRKTCSSLTSRKDLYKNTFAKKNTKNNKKTQQLLAKTSFSIIHSYGLVCFWPFETLRPIAMVLALEIWEWVQYRVKWLLSLLEYVKQKEKVNQVLNQISIFLWWGILYRQEQTWTCHWKWYWHTSSHTLISLPQPISNMVAGIQDFWKHSDSFKQQMGRYVVVTLDV